MVHLWSYMGATQMRRLLFILLTIIILLSNLILRLSAASLDPYTGLSDTATPTWGTRAQAPSPQKSPGGLSSWLPSLFSRQQILKSPVYCDFT